MKKTHVLLGAFLILMAAACQKEATETEQAAEEIPTKNPGWQKQWYEMKKNEQGFIPYGLPLLWQRQDERLLTKKKESNLLNIREIGPTNIGGRTRAIWVDPDNDNRVLAGGVSGGIWESVDNGGSWKAVNDGAANLSITCITSNPFNHDVMYYGTGEASGNSTGIDGIGIYKSTDRGKSWFLLENSSIPALSKSWDIKHSLTDKNTFYIGTENNGLYCSKDGGESFVQLFSAGRDVNDIEVFEDSVLLYAAARDGVYEVNENSGQRTLLSASFSPAPSTASRMLLASCKNHPNVLYCQQTDNNGQSMAAQYKSSDRGKTWTPFNGPDDIVGYNQAWYDLLLEVHPDDSNFLFAGGVRTAYSTDGGQSWKEASHGHVDIHSLIWKANNTKFWVGSDGGLHEFNVSNPEGNLVSKNNGYNVTQFYAGYFFSDQAHTIGGTQDNNTLYGPNGGNINVSVLGGDGAYCFVSHQDDRLLYASWQNANLHRFTNGPFGGRTRIDRGFKASNETVWFINPYTINPADGTQLYHTTYRGLWRSLNMGSTWDKITATNLPGQFYSVTASNDFDPVLYFGGAASIIYRIDSARSAAAGTEKGFIQGRPIQALGGFTSCIEINPQNKNSIVVGFSNVDTDSRIWKIVNTHTDDFSWVDISGNLPVGLPVNWVEMDPLDSNFIMAATDFGLYTTKDGGINWVKESAIPDVSIHQIRLREDDGTLYIYTHGRGIWKADIYDPANVADATMETKPLQLYPNPTRDYLNIPNELSVEEVQIFTLSGELVGTTNQQKIDVRSLKSGLYILHLIADGRRYSSKWIKN